MPIETKNRTFKCQNGNFRESQNLFVAALTSARLEFSDFGDTKWKIKEFDEKKQTLTANLNVIKQTENIGYVFTLKASFFSGNGNTSIDVFLIPPSEVKESLSYAVWTRTELLLQASFWT